MTRWIKKRLSYANVVASTALFVSLGGTSYAAITLKANSVRSSHIKNGQVKRADLAKGAVAGAQVADGSLLAGDFAPGQLPRGERGETGPAGPQGPKGDTGTVDTAGFFSKEESDRRFLGASAKAADADRLDGRDSSAFPHLFGAVSADGTVTAGSGFSATRVMTGVYKVEFPAGTFQGCVKPIVLVTLARVDYPRMPATEAWCSKATGAGSFTLLMHSPSGPVVDSPFDFMVK